MRAHPVQPPPRDVLVVEDDVEISDALCTLLRYERYEARAAHTLLSARAQLSKKEPSCVVLDLNLSDGTTEDLLRELSVGAHDTPCVMMSASRDAPRVARRFGVPLVAKPFSLDTLLEAIVAAIEGAIHPREASLHVA